MRNVPRTPSRNNQFLFYIDKLSKLIVLNLLVLLFSLPLVSVGAAISAMHRVLQDLYADEEVSVFLMFWQAFKANFWKATGIWLCFAALGAFLLWDYWLLRTGVLPEADWLQWPLYLMAILLLCGATWSFILQSHYENSVFATMRNGFLFTFLYFIATVMLVLAAAIPMILLYLSLYFMPVVLLFGISGVGLLQTMLYSKIFDNLDASQHTKCKL